MALNKRWLLYLQFSNHSPGNKGGVLPQSIGASDSINKHGFVTETNKSGDGMAWKPLRAVLIFGD
jgi:hypothetical protein